ncbi:major facilitator superfamily domain-containing protein [Lactarius quietus]|nr:major facilitator superfamily domain-containing protein [Lactarius quietus]
MLVRLSSGTPCRLLGGPLVKLTFRCTAMLMSLSSPHVNPTDTPIPHARNSPSHQEKPKAGASWKAPEQQVLTQNRLWIVFPGLMACVFLAALDQTSVAKALATIVEELGEGRHYNWVGSAYMLASGAFSPLYGKLSDLIGRKPFLYPLYIFICVLIGLDSGNEIGWSSAETITLLCVGCTLLILAAMNETFTTRSPIIPPRLFKTRTTRILLITCFLHAVTTFAGAYYLPLYYQVIRLSATSAGIRMIPFSLGTAETATISGFALTRLGAYRGMIWAPWATMIIGWGLMSTLSDHSNTAEKALYPLIVSTGVGCLFPIPLIALQSAMPLKDMATSTGAYGFLRTMGGTVGISIGQAIYTTVLKRKINRIPDLSGINTSPAALPRISGRFTACQ